MAMLTLAIAPAVEEARGELGRRQLPVVGLAERLVRVDLGDGLALLETFLQPEQVAVDALAVGSPPCVLQMARDRLAEERSAVHVL